MSNGFTRFRFPTVSTLKIAGASSPSPWPGSTPIAPRSRLYRGIRLLFTPPEKATVLRVARQDVDGKAVSRGTVQHEALEGDSAMDIAVDAELKIPVACFVDAGVGEGLPAAGIPYALAVSLEVAPKTGLPIYEEVRDRIQPGQGPRLAPHFLVLARRRWLPVRRDWLWIFFGASRAVAEKSSGQSRGKRSSAAFLVRVP